MFVSAMKHQRHWFANVLPYKSDPKVDKKENIAQKLETLHFGDFSLFDSPIWATDCISYITVKVRRYSFSLTIVSQMLLVEVIYTLTFATKHSHALFKGKQQKSGIGWVAWIDETTILK